MFPAAALGVKAGSCTRACAGVRERRAVPLAVRSAVPHVPETHRHTDSLSPRRDAAHLPGICRRHLVLHVRKLISEVGFIFQYVRYQQLIVPII